MPDDARSSSPYKYPVRTKTPALCLIPPTRVHILHVHEKVMGVIYRSESKLTPIDEIERIEPVRLKDLKGIAVYYEDDLHDVAETILKLYDAKSKKKKENSIIRPTLHGLVQIFANLVDACNPDTQIVKRRIQKKNLNMRSTVKFDDEPNY